MLMHRSEDCRFEFRKRGFRVCIKNIFEASITKDITLGAGCFRDAIGIDKAKDQALSVVRLYSTGGCPA